MVLASFVGVLDFITRIGKDKSYKPLLYVYRFFYTLIRI